MEGGALRRQAGVAIKACSRKGQSSLAAHLGCSARVEREYFQHRPQRVPRFKSTQSIRNCPANPIYRRAAFCANMIRERSNGS